MKDGCEHDGDPLFLFDRDPGSFQKIFIILRGNTIHNDPQS